MNIIYDYDGTPLILEDTLPATKIEVIASLKCIVSRREGTAGRAKSLATMTLWNH